VTVELAGTVLRFADPVALVLLLAIPPLVALQVVRGRRRGGGVLFPSLSLLPARRPLWRTRLRGSLIALRAATLVLMIVALARPQVVSASEVPVEAIDICVVLDVSETMVEDIQSDGHPITAAKNTLHQLLGQLRGDRISLVVFATQALVLAPLTTDYHAVDTLVSTIEDRKLVGADTDIGLGLATGENVLRDSTAKSKVIVLFTDADDQSKTITPQDAANAAKVLGIRIYTVAAITAEFRDPTGQPTVEGGPQGETLMTQIAQLTGGSYHRVNDTAGLRDAFDEMQRLERSRVGFRTELASYQDAMLPFLLAAVGLALAQLILELTAFRRAP
jgi:Ca-activated chloride channel homolog